MLLGYYRLYATHRGQPASSLLSQALDQKARASGGQSLNNDTAGPFQLGMIQRGSGQERPKPWSELSTTGKVMRTTARTTNLTVILLGAGLFTVLTYSLTSELFSSNSPTVLYGEACDKIRRSSKVARYLHAPLVFHNNPPSSTRPRHRNHNVNSRIAVDASGREHLLLNFYISSSPTSSTSTTFTDSEQTWVDKTIQRTQAALTDISSITVDDIKDWSSRSLDRLKSSFRYLTGEPAPSIPPTTGPSPTSERPKERQGFLKTVVLGVFSMRLGGASSEESRPAAGVTWTEGEVHADLVKNDEGYFVFRYLLIDIPNSRSRNPIRVFVERAPDVRETEPVMRWTQV
ncbi:hypothetical protein PUNSTDRAFT_59521 [Punctularia strigosozonata HHB-11173 SS5]|uniref:uncharacterized protein n=1 Tax=Punctularia strigosozonata (strain HHB-11173) TaxID=741275 RepID=UPI00044184EC|nr:uncharacterized protein PUNSTDRAFT_59521 [Punctularia strigosozonata HHB-11173 SS5]EIN13645.1 hypothetical protein PUNSTDRAFT_59521 [Punctularia strigosozonata HHB-11173 SS5]